MHTTKNKKQNYKNKNYKKYQGFTLIEVLVVIGIIAILAAVVLVAVNPVRQFSQARNTQRISNVAAIVSAMSQNYADNKGDLMCGQLPSTTTEIKSGPNGYDLRNCIVPSYIAEIPLDPLTGTFNSPTDYNTGYQIVQDISSGRITISAPSAELGKIISITR